MTSVAVPETARAILLGAIDYAGLFPPAALDLDRAVATYAEYRVSPARWALGRLVVPAARLQELRPLLDDRRGWRIAATAGPDPLGDLELVAGFNRAGDALDHRVDAFEAKVADATAVDRVATALPREIAGYLEIPLDGELDPLLDRVSQVGLRAKIRMGGVTPELFPAPGAVARFLLGTARRRLPFKATAGLHHPLRGSYPLSYAPDSASNPMYGYLNLFVATAMAQLGRAEEVVIQALLDEDPTAFEILPNGLRWGDQQITDRSLERLRGELHGFGSCSFVEPLEGLRGVLER